MTKANGILGHRIKRDGLMTLTVCMSFSMVSILSFIQDFLFEIVLKWT
jgi:hypothetical protein